MDATAAAAPSVAPPPSADGGSAELLERLRRLSDRVDRLEDGDARDAAQELVAAVLEMHGVGLAKIASWSRTASSPACC
jgi:hypothetical protein